MRTFFFLLSLSLFLSLFLYVAWRFFCFEYWLSSSDIRIQFIFSSVRHTQLNGNTTVIVERRKELVHTHTFFCAYKRLCLLMSLLFFFLLSLFLHRSCCHSARMFNQFFFRMKGAQKREKKENAFVRTRIRLKDASISAWEWMQQRIMEN